MIWTEFGGEIGEKRGRGRECKMKNLSVEVVYTGTWVSE